MSARLLGRLSDSVSWMSQANALSIEPAPTELEAAIISVAIEAMWPKPVLLVPPPTADDGRGAWRFSGRWWARPVAQRRDRPFR